MKNLVFRKQIFTSFLYITVLAFYQSLGDQLHIKKLFFDLAKIVFAGWKKPPWQKLFLPGRFFPWKKPVFSSDRQKLANLYPK